MVRARRGGPAPAPVSGTLVFALALLLTACGGSGDGSASGDRPGPTGEGPAEGESGAPGGFDVRARYTKTAHRIPMRDGVRLFTLVYAPRDTTRDHPILLFRTPYGIGPYEEDAYRSPLGPSERFDRAGYIFVFQDVRGKYESEGEFVESEPLWTQFPNPKDSVDETTDSYDTIEWLLANLRHHNGRVGQWGISYPGWETVAGMVDAHPALAAVSPQASPADDFAGDDWHHNGAFRIMYAFAWLSRNAATVEASAEGGPAPFDYGTPWGYRFFLEHGSAAALDRAFFHGNVPAWNGFMDHPNYDAYWKEKTLLTHLEDVGDLPVLNVAGWFDAEDFYGPLAIYDSVEIHNPENRSTLAVGPWRHGGWARNAGDHLGCVDFGAPTSERYDREVVFPFFEHHLKGREGWDAPEAVVFETGRNRWRAFDRWPPQDVTTRNLYFREGGRLSFDPPPAGDPQGAGGGEAATREAAGGTADADAPATDAGATAADRFVSDPARPVPFSASIRTAPGHLWMIEDQRFAHTRPDVLTYETPPLEEPVTVAGPLVAHLEASTTGQDADWIVKVIDVYPGDAPASPHCDVPMGDFEMLLAGEIMRGRFRKSLERPEPMRPDRPTTIEFSLRDRFHTFLPGHRIMVQLQSTWFPVYDRNPQTWVPNVYRAEPDDYRAREHTVYRSADRPSYVRLPVLPSSGR